MAASCSEWEAVRTLHHGGSHVHSLAFAPGHDEMLAVGLADHSAVIWNNRAERLRTLQSHTDEVLFFFFGRNAAGSHYTEALHNQSKYSGWTTASLMTICFGAWLQAGLVQRHLRHFFFNAHVGL